MNKEQISLEFQQLQDRICAALENTDGRGKFEEDVWERPGGGGGRTRVIGGGNVLEKGGVLFSAVYGATPEKIVKDLNLTGQPDFFATGVSIVLHPHSPMVPIIHMNVRYFEMNNGVCWFGGGIDLTPHYVDEADARYFHQQLKQVCDRHHPDYYPRFKTWADDYFYIRHRQETRGIGGIFFDHLAPSADQPIEALFAFVREVGETFAPVYTHLMEKNAALPFGEPEKRWQALRRGRYVEFNLVWDRGTKFGLDTDGRTESILVSMPPKAEWLYNYQPPEGSREKATLQWLRKGVTWV
jgi:coproporphyrinogen III oxidase